MVHFPLKMNTEDRERMAEENFQIFLQGFKKIFAFSNADCKLKHTRVETAGIQLRGEPSKCVSVPVLRCKEGCKATATTKMHVPHTCVPEGKSMLICVTGIIHNNHSRNV